VDEQEHPAGPEPSAWQAHIAADLVAVGDEELLRRAIDNPLANVRAHTPDGTVATITAAQHGSTVTVDVSDDGPGVPAGRLPRIFDRFYRAAAQPPSPGSGLGLAIVTAVAAAHQGTAQAALNHPHGLRITLTLPACGQPRPAQPPAATSTPSSHTSPAPA
jgi:two-component system OmpR family sensor kinase